MTAQGAAIREAAWEDIPALSELAALTFARAFGDSMTESDLEAHFRRYLSPEAFARFLKTDVILLAESGGRMVGYTQLGDYREESADPGDREIRRLYVHPDFQNRGIGSALMEAALAFLSSAERVFLDVWEQNHAAVRFYRRHGFEVAGTRVFQFESGPAPDPDLVMVRSSRAGASDR